MPKVRNWNVLVAIGCPEHDHTRLRLLHPRANHRITWVRKGTSSSSASLDEAAQVGGSAKRLSFPSGVTSRKRSAMLFYGIILFGCVNVSITLCALAFYWSVEQDCNVFTVEFEGPDGP
jgi:hypothetical protein